MPTVGYHRALSAEGILSLKPTLIIHDNNIGPEKVVRQLQALNIPMKTFQAKDDSVEGAKALLREMGAYFHKEQRAEELCAKLDRDMAAAAEEVKKYTDPPRVAVIHFGRASNMYMVVGNGGGGDASTAGKMVELAGGKMAIEKHGMQRMASPEIVAEGNPDVILMTEFGFDRLGSAEQGQDAAGRGGDRRREEQPDLPRVRARADVFRSGHRGKYSETRQADSPMKAAAPTSLCATSCCSC